MEKVVEIHNFLFQEIADPRVYNWSFMSSPWKLLVIAVLYLCSIYMFLPFYMATRKAYKLKGVIAAYNIFQIVSNLIIIYGVATSGWTTYYTLGCEIVDYSADKMALRMASYMWWVVILKLIEFTDTILFVLRKKYNQVSGFHVFHHVSTLLIAWIFAKYTPGGMYSLYVLLNLSVHVLMYTYYLLSSFGPEMQRKLRLAKFTLTAIQMVQLIVMMFHSTQSLLPSCKFPSLLACIIVPDVIINLYFFYNFFVASYVKGKSS